MRAWKHGDYYPTRAWSDSYCCHRSICIFHIATHICQGFRRPSVVVVMEMSFILFVLFQPEAFNCHTHTQPESSIQYKHRRHFRRETKKQKWNDFVFSFGLCYLHNIIRLCLWRFCIPEQSMDMMIRATSVFVVSTVHWRFRRTCSLVGPSTLVSIVCFTIKHQPHELDAFALLPGYRRASSLLSLWQDAKGGYVPTTTPYKLPRSSKSHSLLRIVANRQRRLPQSPWW